MSKPLREEEHEFTETYLPASWLAVLSDHISKYVQDRDAGRETPDVPDCLRLRNLPSGADFDAFRALVEGAWDDAGDELECSVSVMYPCDAMSMDGIRLNMATYLWYGLNAYDSEDTPPRGDEGVSYEDRLRRVEKKSFSDLRNLPSPKWRTWFADTWADRVAIHDTLVQCGVEATSHLGADLCRAGYTFDADVSRMTVEELIIRLEARHRFFAAAFRAGRSPAAEPGGASGQAAFSPKRVPNRPPHWEAIMEMVAQVKRDNGRWKEIRERVQAVHGYPFDSDEALRKQFERWQKNRGAAE